MNLYVFQIVFYDFANSADRSRHVKRPGLKQTQIVSALLLKNIDYYKAV